MPGPSSTSGVTTRNRRSSATTAPGLAHLLSRAPRVAGSASTADGQRHRCPSAHSRDPKAPAGELPHRLSPLRAVRAGVRVIGRTRPQVYKNTKNPHRPRAHRETPPDVGEGERPATRRRRGRPGTPPRQGHSGRRGGSPRWVGSETVTDPGVEVGVAAELAEEGVGGVPQEHVSPHLHRPLVVDAVVEAGAEVGVVVGG